MVTTGTNTGYGVYHRVARGRWALVARADTVAAGWDTVLELMGAAGGGDWCVRRLTRAANAAPPDPEAARTAVSRPGAS